MAYEKAYELIGFVNGAPPSLGATNLNRIDSAINTIDDRIIAVDEKATDAYNNAGAALSGIAAIQALYATKEEVTESIAELESELSETYATKSELAEVSETVTEIATEVSKGKADVILANAQGESIHLTDSTDNEAVEFALIGKATQNGTPTPDARIDVTISGADGSVEVKSVGKNLLKNKRPSFNTQGINFTVNEDGSVIATGTQTGHAYYDFGHAGTSGLLPYIDVTKRYILSGNTTTNSNEWGYSLYLQINLENGTTRYVFNNNPVDTVVNFNEYNSISPITSIIPYIRIGADAPKPVNVKFYPMLSLEGGEYETYKESTTTITTEGGLAGINGVCDEKRVYADGSGKYIQRIGKAVFDGSDDEGWTIGTTLTAGRNRFICSSISNGKADGNILCNALTRISYADFYNTTANNVISLHSPNGTIQCVATDFADVTAWKSYLASNPMTVWYELAEPIITDLSAEEIAELEVQTFYPTTNILNDEGCGMEVTYKADTRNYIDRIIGERISAIETALINNI